MAVEFEKLKFTRDWNSSADFPTYEENEQKVRADLQALHDETKEFINETLIPGIEKLAVPGTGDMKAEVYDPWNKRKDVYQYADEKAAETVEEHLTQAHHVDAYSKEESLSAETREALGLDESATPDDALKAAADEVNRVAGLPALVMDVNTGKKYTVETRLLRVPSEVHAALANSTLFAQHWGYYSIGYSSPIRRCGNKLFLAYALRSTANNTQYTYSYVRTIDVETGEMSREFPLGSNTSGYASTFVPARLVDPTNTVVAYGYNTASANSTPVFTPSLLDTSTGVNMAVTSGLIYFATKNYICSLQTSSASQRTIQRYARKSSTATNFTYAPQYNGSYEVVKVDAENDIVWILEAVAGKRYCLTKIDVATGTVSIGQKYFEFSYGSASSMSLTLMCEDDEYVHFKVYAGTGVSATSVYLDRAVRFNKTTMELETDMLAEASAITDSSFTGYCTCKQYIGTVDNCAYFLTGTNSVVYILDKDTCAFSSYAAASGTLHGGDGSGIEAKFDIPGMPGVILTGRQIFDTRAGTFRPIPGGNEKWPTTGAIVLYYDSVTVGTQYAGHVTDTNGVGIISPNLLVGGEPEFTVKSLVEYKEK